MRELLLPEKMLADINTSMPWIWRTVDQVRAMRGPEIPDWDNHVFMPMNGWGKIFSGAVDKRDLQMQDIATMEIITILGAWRPSQDVVRFDDQVYGCLLDTPFNGSLPSEIPWRLPAWSVYVETPGLIAYCTEWAGYLAMLNQRGREDKLDLRIIFMNRTGETLAELLSLGDWTLQEAMVLGKPAILKNPDSKLDIPEEAEPRKPYPALKAAISLLLYICAYGFLEDRHLSFSNLSYPTAKRTKKGWRIFPPVQPKVHDMGQEIGNTLRAIPHSVQHGEGGEHKSPRPHLRRAHWHGFWSGPRKDAEKRRFDLTCLPRFLWLWEKIPQMSYRNGTVDITHLRPAGPRALASLLVHVWKGCSKREFDMTFLLRMLVEMGKKLDMIMVIQQTGSSSGVFYFPKWWNGSLPSSSMNYCRRTLHWKTQPQNLLFGSMAL